MTKTPRIGIYPGTFDPITVGHMDIITRALKVVDKLVIAVALDTGKEPVFAVEKRAELVAEDIKNLGADAERIEVRHFSGLLVNLAEEFDSQDIDSRFARGVGFRI